MSDDIYKDALAALDSGDELPPYRAAKPTNLASNERTPHASKQATSRSAQTGRFQVINSFFDDSARLVSTTAQSAWTVLWRDVKKNGLASMSQSQIAEKMGKSPRTVQRALKELEQAGLITVVKRGYAKRDGTTLSSIYRVHSKPCR